MASAPDLPLRLQVKAFGPGLQGGSAGSPARFTIDTKGAGVGGLGLTVEGPCEAQLECLDNGDGTCSVSYVPTEPGDYNINILFADTHIPGSPFKAHVVPCFDASKVKCSGPGLERATAGEAGQFHVDCSSAGSAELTIEIRSEAGLPAEVHIQDHGDGTHTITYIPLCPGAYTVTIKYGGQPVPNFPSKLQVEPAVDTSGVQCYGPGVEGQGERRTAGPGHGGGQGAGAHASSPHLPCRRLPRSHHGVQRGCPGPDADRRAARQGPRGQPLWQPDRDLRAGPRRRHLQSGVHALRGGCVRACVRAGWPGGRGAQALPDTASALPQGCTPWT